MTEIPDSVLKAAHDYDYAHRAGNWQRVPDNQVRRLLDGLATQGLILVRADDPRAAKQENLDPLNARLTIAEAKVRDLEGAIDRAWDLVDDMRAESPQASTWADRLSVALSKQTGDDND